MLIQLLFALFVKIAFGDKVVRINNASEFAVFSNNVNSGTNYSETTLLLESDLSFSNEVIEPIGNYDKYFRGVFDGQGHIISDLKINSSTNLAGLFGYSKGLTIRNIVLDSSCSITSSYNDRKPVCVGGIIGYCYSYSGECNTENSVNMAGIMPRSTKIYTLHLGGIAGRLLSSPSYPIYVKNCANYGSVTHLGTSSSSYIGGIVGDLFGSSYKYIYNCINYGTITHSTGTTSTYLYLGGIVGYSEYAHIENCVSTGRISAQKTSTQTSYIGNIVGLVGFYAIISYCYYTNDVGIGKLYEGVKPTLIITETPTSPSIINSTLIANLNDYATKNSTWNKWLLNVNNASVSFIINYRKGFTVSSQIVLLPDPANNSEHSFSGWYTDVNLTTLFTLSQVESNTTLYGMFCGSSKYTVTLNVNGGNELGVSESEINAGCMNYYGSLPENVTRTGHTFTGWFTGREGDKIKSGDRVKTLNNHTLYAHWVPNNYTVTFDVNGGNDLSVIIMTVTFNSRYGPLPTPTKEGHMFLGWFTDNNESVTNETIVSIADNHTLYAQWEKTTTHVEIVFSTKGLTEKEVEELLKQYTNAEFTITEFEEESGEIRVIIRFTDNESVANFVENIKESNEMNNIKKIRFVPGDASSISSILYPILFYGVILFI